MITAYKAAILAACVINPNYVDVYICTAGDMYNMPIGDFIGFLVIYSQFFGKVIQHMVFGNVRLEGYIFTICTAYLFYVFVFSQ